MREDKISGGGGTLTPPPRYRIGLRLNEYSAIHIEVDSCMVQRYHVEHTFPITTQTAQTHTYVEKRNVILCYSEPSSLLSILQLPCIVCRYS